MLTSFSSAWMWASRCGNRENSRRARFYRLTSRGSEQLATETAWWARATVGVRRLLRAVAEESRMSWLRRPRDGDDDLAAELRHHLEVASANKPARGHGPQGISIDLDGAGACSVFCAYHNTCVRNGQNVYYGGSPDQGGSCAGGCGGDPSQFNNTTSVTSHELIEAVTDAAVGLATGQSAPL